MRKIVIDPRVIKHLGRDLITSPEVAIIELIKNSIDAKASHINLRLYNSMPSNGLIPDCVSDSVPNKYLASPILVVEDDGCGMTDATIDGGFLKIATDIKSNEESTLGEKGIGRLAAQRLGTALLVETSSDKENHTSYVFIDWNAVINGVVDIQQIRSCWRRLRTACPLWTRVLRSSATARATSFMIRKPRTPNW